MLRIAICDDDTEFLEKLNLFIKEICLKNHIDFRIDCFNDGLSLIEKYEKYHLILLDIEMPLIDGRSVAESLNEKSPVTIFLILFLLPDVITLCLKH